MTYKLAYATLPRMPYDKDTMRPLLQPYFKVTEQIIREGFRYYFETYASEISRHSPRTRATLINDHIVDCAKRLFPAESTASVRISQRNLFGLGNCCTIHFKKLDRRKVASNYPTLFALDFNQQLDLPGLPSKLPRLVAGYVPKKDWSGIESIFLTCPNGHEIEWFFDLALENATDTVVSTSLTFDENSLAASSKRSRIKRPSQDKLAAES